MTEIVKSKNTRCNHVAECNKAETGVGPSWHQVTKDAKRLCRFSTAARIEKEQLLNCLKEYEKS